MQNEPQLAKDVEKRLKEWSEDPERGMCADFTTDGYAYYDELKAFLATELERQRIAYVEAVEMYFAHIQNDGLYGEPMRIKPEELADDVLAILKKARE